MVIAALVGPLGSTKNEGNEVTAGFLAEHPDAPPAELPAPWEAAPDVEVDLVEIPGPWELPLGCFHRQLRLVPFWTRL